MSGLIQSAKGVIERFFAAGSPRTQKAKKNVLGLFVLRGITTGVNFLLVPLTLQLLGSTEYGIWLTLSSIITWISFLDIGLGNGLRNKIAEAIAQSDEGLARQYVSTTYAYVGAIVLIFLVVFLTLNTFLPWVAILNAPPGMDAELRMLAGFVATFFCLRLLASLIGAILMAHQRPAANSALDVLVGILSLIAVFLLQITNSGSLLLLGIILSAITVIIPLIASIWLFAGRYAHYRPTLRAVNRAHTHDLMSLGVQFLFLQLAALVIFSTPNVVIAQLFGPAEVTPYNIAMKYYGVALTAFSIIVAPTWSAYTDAYVRGDTDWIKRAMAKLRTVWMVLSGVVIQMIIAAPHVYDIWVGSEVQVPLILSLGMAAYVLVYCWSSIYANFLSGVGKIRLQLYVGIIAAVIVVPFSVFLALHVFQGSAGIVFAVCMLLLPSCFLWPMQVRRLLNRSARGIWNQ
jgi:O-antigen/teichoic acid export membrane protein